MDQLTRLASERQHQLLANAETQRPAQRLLSLARATRRAERAERRMHRAARHARRLRAQLQAQTAPISDRPSVTAPAITTRRT